MKSLPAFPENLPVIRLTRISLSKLLADDTEESTRLFQASKNLGYFLIDLDDHPCGQLILRQTEDALALSKEFCALEQDEKIRFPLDSRSIGQSIPFLLRCSP